MSDFTQKLEKKHTVEVVDRISNFVVLAEEFSSMSEVLVENIILHFDADCFLEEALDVADHGFIGDVNGWGHFEDTNAFYKANKIEIIKWMEHFVVGIAGCKSVSDFIFSSRVLIGQDIEAKDVEIFLASNDESAKYHGHLANYLCGTAANELCNIYKTVSEQEVWHG